MKFYANNPLKLKILTIAVFFLLTENLQAQEVLSPSTDAWLPDAKLSLSLPQENVILQEIEKHPQLSKKVRAIFNCDFNDKTVSNHCHLELVRKK